MKYIKLLAVLICVLALSGCNKDKSKNVDKEKDIPPTSGSNIQKDNIPMSSANLSTEDGIRDYLIGEWLCSIEYTGNVIKMNIDKDLNVDMSIQSVHTNKTKADYKGKIKFDRIYASKDEAPDLILIELNDKEYPEGKFFFLNRTIYDGKRIMSLFFAGEGNSIFNMLVRIDEPENYGYLPEEIICEKITGEKSELSTIKNEEFYATFWGHGVKYEGIWLDDVIWTPAEEDEYATVYPSQMTAYENTKQESVLYSISPGMDFEILGDEMFRGEVYFVETDQNGNIIQLMNAEYKNYLEGSSEPEIEELVYDILMSDIVEIQEYLDAGMSILFTGETTIIDGEECYDVSLGTNHEENFVREIHYTVNIATRQVYRYDVLNDIWESVAAG